MEQPREVPVVNLNSSGRPHALVFAGRVKSLTPGEAKRARFVQHLNTNYNKLKEALDFIEKSCAEMLDELTVQFENKLQAYDARRNK
jgi:hypothetical protein